MTELAMGVCAMILKSEPAPIHNVKTCKTCNSDVFIDIVNILHAAEGVGMVPAMLCVVHPTTGEISSYTCDGVDGDELITALAKTVSRPEFFGVEEGVDISTAIKSGERGN